ncbi:MAG TPA: NUDIX domain-containing protein [Actinomycetales bacterium]|nr:NUDIX domain-containing protein [Actinomycetales bacterium]
MPEELVALYAPDDDTGRVTGTAPRSRVRAENLPHAATAVLLVDEEGRVYVHRRTETKDVFPGMWDCWAGGVVTAGEDPQEAASRELVEELGVHVPRLEPLFRHWYRDDRTHYLACCYRARWQSEALNGPVVHQPDEVAEGGWTTLAGLRELLADPTRPFVPDGRVGIERYLAGDLTGHAAEVAR